MKLYPTKKKGTALRAILPIVLIAVVLAFFLYGFSSVSRSTEQENRRMTEKAIRSALVNCYAVEGAYPQKLSYLEEHYGLIIDHNHYDIQYTILGSNIMPSVAVVPWGSGDHNLG